MSFRPAALVIVALLQVVATIGVAEAQRQKFKMGGGAGFAKLSDPDVDPGGSFALGGFFGFRFSDNFSFETAFTFMRSSRVFADTGVPVDSVRALPAFRFETSRIHLDGIFMYNIGRRQPFHPFVYAGGGIILRNETRTDFKFQTDPNTGRSIPISEEVTLNRSEYEPTGLGGIGADIYFKYNIAARAELRLWFPQSTDKRDRMFFFSASYFF